MQRPVQIEDPLLLALLLEVQERPLHLRLRLQQLVLARLRHPQRQREVRVRLVRLRSLTVQDPVKLVRLRDARLRAKPMEDLQRPVAAFLGRVVTTTLQMQLGPVQLHPADHHAVPRLLRQIRRLLEARLRRLPLREIHVRHAHVVERPRHAALVVHPPVPLQRGAITQQRHRDVALDVGDHAEVLIHGGDHPVHPHRLSHLSGLQEQVGRSLQGPPEQLHVGQAHQSRHQLLLQVVLLRDLTTRLELLDREIQAPTLSVHRPRPA